VAHQALDAVAADVLSGAQQRLPHPPVAVGVVVRRVRGLDELQQPLVVNPTL
jgi:hypothetical protein